MPTDEKARPEGWMAVKPLTASRYHYIGKDGRALCGGWAFYTGELEPDDGKPELRITDCARCFRILRKGAKRG